MDVPFQDAVKSLDQTGKWYKFLNSLYSKFSEYGIQYDRSRYNVIDIEDWGKQEKPQGIKINQNNFEKFFNKIAEYNIAEYDNIKNITVTGLQLEELNHILNLTLKHKMDISCIEQYMFIKGDYIGIQEIIVNILMNLQESYNDTCKDLINSGKLKFINIFSLNTVFMDIDISLPGKSITVVAPKWEIIDTRKLELRGTDGQSHYDYKPSIFPFLKTMTKSKAKGGTYPGSKGTDGLPGGPGGPGGNFFGITEQVINGINLTIIVNGGTGGSGQNGGDGGNGQDGINPMIPSSAILCSPKLCDNNKQINGFDCTYLSTNRNFNVFRMYLNTFKIFGKAGKKGGYGGNGGRGGKGGNPGNIILFELNNYSGISKYNSTGEDGENGIGGIGGVDGMNGDDIVVKCHVNLSCYAFNCYVKSSDWNLQDRVHNRRAQSGKNGTDGANTRNMENPKAAVKINEPAKIINEYKIYLRKNLNDCFKKPSLIQFLNQLDNNNNVKNVYDTLGFVDELQGLEEQFYKLNKDIDFLPFYQSLLNRITEYAQNLKDVENLIEHKKVISYLYTAILGKINNLQDNLESNLIVNIPAYLNSVKKDIDTLKDLKKIKNKVDIINKYKQEYKNGIDAKIKEAEYFIENEITPEIDNIGTEIDKEINSLVAEVVKLERKVEEETKELIEIKQELQNTLALGKIFGILKILGGIVSFFGPVGTIAGSLVGAGSTIVEALVLDTQNSQHRTLELQQSVVNLQSLKDQIKTISDQKNNLNKLVKDISEEINKYPEKLGHISVKIVDIQNRLNKVNEHKFNYKKVQVLENELKVILQEEGDLIKAQQGITDHKTQKAIAVIEKYIKITQVGFDIYNKYKNDKAQLDAITHAIKQKENELQTLKQYEEKIYDTIAPILQNIQNDLNDIASKLGTKSHVSLNVIKWRVQDTLRDTKLHMKQLTKTFKVKDNLARCVEKLEEAMTTLINVYDHIQDYQKQQNLANYIADISSITASNINIVNDSNLKKAVENLEIIIQSNIVLQRYKVAIDAFKQFVFPFAHLYFEELILPSYLKLGSNIDAIVSKAATEIEHIQTKLEDYQQTVRQYDKTIGTGDFNSNGTAIQPFFVWKNEQHKNMISKLLSGQEVIVKADIINSAIDKDAIKFNHIELQFKAKDEIKQSEINNILTAFEISATHLGNSYYRYDDKIYLIITNSYTIDYYFERRHNDQKPVHTSMVYDKINYGNFILSPYTTWKIRLYNVPNKYNFTFSDLEIYKDEIDLELSGYARYVKHRYISELDLLVENYYKTVNTYDQLDLNVESKILNTCGTVLNQRYVRSVDEADKVCDACATNGAVFSMSSPVNYVCNLLKETILKLKNLNPVDQIKSLFNMNDERVQIKILDFDVLGNSLYHDNDLFELSESCVDTNMLLGTGYKEKQISHRLIDYTDNINNVANSDLLAQQSTLLLLDLLVRKKSGVKYNNKEAIVMSNNDTNSEYAQSLAYSAYLLEDNDTVPNNNHNNICA